MLGAEFYQLSYGVNHFWKFFFGRVETLTIINFEHFAFGGVETLIIKNLWARGNPNYRMKHDDLYSENWNSEIILSFMKIVVSKCLAGYAQSSLPRELSTSGTGDSVVAIFFSDSGNFQWPNH